MLHITTETMINRPVDQVFSFVADQWFTNLPVWNHDLTEITKTSEGPVSSGTTGHEVQIIQGKPYSRAFTFENFERNRSFAMRSLEPSSKETYYCTYQFEQVGSATKLTTTFNFGWPTLMFKVFKPFIRSAIRKSLNENYGVHLKQALEV